MSESVLEIYGRVRSNVEARETEARGKASVTGWSTRRDRRGDTAACPAESTKAPKGPHVALFPFTMMVESTDKLNVYLKVASTVVWTGSVKWVSSSASSMLILSDPASEIAMPATRS